MNLIILPPWVNGKIARPTVSDEQIDTLDSDHGLIDGLRRVAAMHTVRAQRGEMLSRAEVQLIGMGKDGVLRRQAIEDAQKQADALNKLLEAAEGRTWEYEESD